MSPLPRRRLAAHLLPANRLKYSHRLSGYLSRETSTCLTCPSFMMRDPRRRHSHIDHSTSLAAPWDFPQSSPHMAHPADFTPRMHTIHSTVFLLPLSPTTQLSHAHSYTSQTHMSIIVPQLLPLMPGVPRAPLASRSMSDIGSNGEIFLPNSLNPFVCSPSSRPCSSNLSGIERLGL